MTVTLKSSLRLSGQILPRAALVGSILFATGLTAETIYRCDRPDGTIIFSDQPCDESGRKYHPVQRLSVVDSPPRLAARLARNHAFIDQRREKLRLRRERQEDRLAAESPAATPPMTRQLIPFPVWAALPPVMPPEPPESQPVTPRDQERFSALSGPFPGTVRYQVRQ